MSRPPIGGKKMPEKVVLQKTGTHVEVTAGPYTKRQLRELLLSSLSLLAGASDPSSNREAELLRLSGVDPDDVRRVKDGQVFGADGKELFEEESKALAALRLVSLINDEGNADADPEDRSLGLLRGRGISEALINGIIKHGLTDETIRLLKALGLTDEEIAQLLGTWDKLVERDRKSEESRSSVPSSSSDECMTAEGFYLMSSFKKPLTKALGDIVSKKPWNPAEYLGHWLLNYKMCEERSQKRKEFEAEVQAERERLRIEMAIGARPDSSEQDGEGEGELAEDWDLMEYEGD